MDTVVLLIGLALAFSALGLFFEPLWWTLIIAAVLLIAGIVVGAHAWRHDRRLPRQL